MVGLVGPLCAVVDVALAPPWLAASSTRVPAGETSVRSRLPLAVWVSTVTTRMLQMKLKLVLMVTLEVMVLKSLMGWGVWLLAVATCALQAVGAGPLLRQHHARGQTGRQQRHQEERVQAGARDLHRES